MENGWKKRTFFEGKTGHISETARNRAKVANHH